MPLMHLETAEIPEPDKPSDRAGFGSIKTSAGLFPMRALSVDTHIVGLAYTTKLAQRFVNVYADPLEATYIFPLPGRAAVVACRMRIDERVIEAELRERQVARETYAEAIRAGRRAALAEEERSECFTMTVGNVMPGDVITVELEVVGELAWDDGEAGYRFPLVVAPRYIPGTVLPVSQSGGGQALDTDLVPDASRISPPVLLKGYPNPVQLAMDVRIEAAGLKFSAARCNMPCEVIEQGEERLHLRLQPGQRLDRDFLIRLPLERNDGRPMMSALLAPGIEKNASGIMTVTVVPPSLADGSPARDVIVLLDRSGSMRGWKMVAARRAAARLIESLDTRDRFRVLVFDNKCEEPPDFGGRLVAGNDANRHLAGEWLRGIEARGGTEIAEPLKTAMTCLAANGAGRARSIVLVTDGQVGNEAHLLRVMAKNAAGIHVYPVGIDQAVNAGFLERLAIQTGGACELVDSELRLDEVLDRVRARLGRPAFTGAKLESRGFVLSDFAPERHGDGYSGKPWIVRARCTPAPEGAEGLTLGATLADGSTVIMAIPIRRIDDEASSGRIATVWARQRIRDLEDQFISEPTRREELEKEIVRISLAHHVLCRFTAWIAVDSAEAAHAGGTVRIVTQAVDLPAGWEPIAAALSDRNCHYSMWMMADTEPEVMCRRELTWSEMKSEKLAKRRPVREDMDEKIRSTSRRTLNDSIDRLIAWIDTTPDSELLEGLAARIPSIRQLIDDVVAGHKGTVRERLAAANLNRYLTRLKRHLSALDPAAVREAFIALMAALRRELPQIESAKPEGGS